LIAECSRVGKGLRNPGRDIRKYGPTGGSVMLDGQKYVINAKIYALSVDSAPADQKNLADFVRRMRVRRGSSALSTATRTPSRPRLGSRLLFCRQKDPLIAGFCLLFCL
jgi:hypothetical protein